MASTYNAYSDIKSIVDLKGQWDEANKAGDTTKKNQIAATAQAYYDKLKNNDYGGVAQALSANGYSGAKAILDSYAPANESNVNNQAYNNSMQSATKNNETLTKYIDSDRKDVQGKYDDIYDYANQDVTKTDEYKSTYNNMMAKYDLSALQGRDNAVASGGSSNGGNIDSYSAANAMRQQAALTAQGQQVAHQAGLDAYNSRISNVSNILNNLGIYNSGTYDAMNKVIGNDSAIAQQYFDNDETAKNNEVARLSEKANVTGYVPNEWAYENNIYLNKDGTVRAEYLTDEFDSTGGFTTIINNAKAKLATTTDATERANLQATIDQATQAKALKTYSSPKYAKYANEVSAITGTPTEAARQANLNAETALKSLGAELEANNANNQNKIDLINAETQANKDLMKYQAELSGGSGQLSEEAIETAKIVVGNINKKITAGLTDEFDNGKKEDFIVYNGRGQFSLNLPKGKTKDDYRTEIINGLFNSSLTVDEAGQIASSLGYTSDDILAVQNSENNNKSNTGDIFLFPGAR